MKHSSTVAKTQTDELELLREKLAELEDALELQKIELKQVRAETAKLSAVKDVGGKGNRSSAGGIEAVQSAARAQARLEIYEKDLAKAQAENAELRRTNEAKLSAALERIRSVELAAEEKLSARHREIAQLTTMLAEQAAAETATERDNAWLREMMIATARVPKWWAILPESLQRKRRHAFYRRAGLFDVAAYLNSYPDVAQDGMDPLRHYILHGMAERRERPLP